MGVQYLLRFDFESGVAWETGNEGGFHMTPQPSDWRHLAEQASNEMDPHRLIDLVVELDRMLGEHEKTCRQPQHRK
jgi:hypothetical protein